MPEFDFYIDRKFTAWDRDHYSIEADSEEEAIEMMKKHFRHPHDDSDIDPARYEDLLDSRHDLSPNENNGEATRQLFQVKNTVAGDNLLLDNISDNPTK